ncbi:MAG: LysR family transcriptional regulator [Xanthomonadaceae bacterium]|jgi:DNA-binding transcriptional LysR family regulator|nr:LysR family transcriptional regulator [Xanthomonadaceae bacterium]
MDKFTLMHTFRRVVELGGFARAAEDLGRSPAGLSKQIRQLEEELGTVLIQRTTRRMSLTEAGMTYYSECRRLLNDVEALEQSVRAQSEELGGRLRLNAPVSFGLNTLSPLLSRFMIRHPQIKIDLILEDRVLDIVDGGFDLAIRSRPELEDPNLVARRLASLQHLLCAAPAYLRQHPMPLTLDELDRHDLLAHVSADGPPTWHFYGPEGTRQFALPSIRASVNNNMLLRDLLIAGLGIGSLPSFLAEPAIVQGTLTPILAQYHQPERHIHAVYPGNRHLQPRVHTLISFLAETLPRAMHGDY